MPKQKPAKKCKQRYFYRRGVFTIEQWRTIVGCYGLKSKGWDERE
jgi:hypothetical protein